MSENYCDLNSKDVKLFEKYLYCNSNYSSKKCLNDLYYDIIKKYNVKIEDIYEIIQYEVRLDRLNYEKYETMLEGEIVISRTYYWMSDIGYKVFKKLEDEGAW